MADAVDNFLVHFGVKGMKWGVRRDQGGRVQLGAAPRRAHARRMEVVKKVTTPKPTSSDHKSLVALKSKRARHLTDAELKSAIGRMNLERQYSQLNPNKVSRGYKIAIAGLALGTTVNSAIVFAKSPAGQAIAAGVKKALAAKP